MGACELCGKESRLKRSKVEGILMDVCNNCSKFGSMLTSPKGRNFRSRSRPSMDKDVMSLLVPDYSKLIKGKREEMGLKQEHLAKKMGVKESMIHHIENGKLRPSNELAKRFERTLSLNILSSGKTD